MKLKGIAPILTFLLTTVGLPATAMFKFSPAIAQQPLWAQVLLAIAWLVFFVVGALWTKIWKHLGDKWGKDLATWIDVSIRNLLSRYRRRYLEFVYYQNRDFDVKGLSTHGPYNLELEDVFVDLTIAPRPVHDTTTDPIRPVPAELAGRRQIWDFLNSDALANAPLVLIGPPGSGKTTLLKEIALQLTGRHRKRPRIKGKLPILLFLREHGEAVRENETYTLPQAVEKALDRKHGPMPPSRWVERQLNAGRCLVLLDGLDEVASAETRKRVVAWVGAQMKAYARNDFFISSRPHGYRSNPISGVTLLEVQSFNLQQVRRFVSNWYRANEAKASQKADPGVEMKAREGAEDLIRRLWTSQTLMDLAVNPLLLTMISTVHRYRSSLPGRRVELYAEICEVFLGKRQASKGVEGNLTPAQKRDVLQPLAFHLMCGEKREISVDEAVRIIKPRLLQVAGAKADSVSFLKDVENGSGMLLEREADVYGFAHLAFQEYLAAVHAWEEGKEETLVQEVENPWWHEMLRLYGAQGDASSLLEACLSEPPTVVALNLAIDFLEEARKVEPKWRKKVDDFIAKGVESNDPERFRLAAETLLERRVRSMIAVDKTTFIDLGFVTHAEYQLFLDEMKAERKFYQPDHWTQRRFTEGQALTAVVGVRPSDVVAFCQFLSQRYAASNFRLPNYGELTRHDFHRKPGDRSGKVFGHWSQDDERLLFEHGRTDFVNPHTEYLFDLMAREFPEHEPKLRSHTVVEALDLDLDLDLVRAFNRAGAGARARGLSLALPLSLPLSRAFDCGLNRSLVSDLDRASALNLLGAAIDAQAFKENKPVFKELLELEKDVFTIYQVLVILDGRRKDKLNAFEGIRLVRELREDV